MFIVNEKNSTKLKFIPTSGYKFTGSSLFRYNLINHCLEEKRENTLQIERLVTDTGHIIPQNLLDLITLEEETEKENIKENMRFYKLNATKIRRKLYAWFNTEQGKKKMSFVTVTFPGQTDDNEIYRIFNLFLTKLRKYENLLSYLWVAERQKNGTIHYHILTTDDVFIKEWNNHLRIILINLYNKNNLHFKGYNPIKYNGVDIAKDRKTKKVINFASKNNQKAVSYYITKYITKNDTKMNRFVWHCSRNISVLFTSVVLPDSFLQEWEEKNTDKKVYENEKLSVYRGYALTCSEYLEELKQVNQMLYDTFLIAERQLKLNATIV